MDRYQTAFQNLKSKKQDPEQQGKPPRLQKACWPWQHQVSELTDAHQHHHLQHRRIPTPTALGVQQPR